MEHLRGLCRVSARGEVEIAHVPPQQQVADAPAHEVELVTGVGEKGTELDRQIGDIEGCAGRMVGHDGTRIAGAGRATVLCVPVWLGFIWTSPNTLIGLLAGLLTFQRPSVRAGLLLFDRTPRGLTWLMLRADRVAVTIGFVIVSARPVEGQLLAHERHHVRQYCAWGPLFIPVYLLLAIPYGYRRHPMELAAQRAAGEISDQARVRTASRRSGRR